MSATFDNTHWKATEARCHTMKLIYSELDRQIELVRSGKIPHTCESMADRPYEAFPILIEEIGEVGRAFQTGDEDNFKEELVQVAAVAIAWISGIVERDLKRGH